MTSKLKIIKKGTGSALLVIHGWGMNHAIWQPIAQQLEQHFTVYYLDLAGHGINRDIPFGSLAHSSALIAAEIPAQTMILAWSLGGLIAQQIARQQPNKVQSLCLVASSPCFVQTDTWKTAMQAQVLANFAQNLETDFVATLSRFLALQFLGVKGVQTEVKQLRQQLLTQPPATPALRDGLAILQTANFTQIRPSNPTYTIPTHWIFGTLDRLVPISVASVLSKRPNTTVTRIEKAGHAPFISHPDEFMAAVLMGFLGTHYVK